MKRFWLMMGLMVWLLTSLALAATLQGSIYNSNLDLEKDVLVEVNSLPVQKMLSKDGNYQFKLPLGEYQLTATKADTVITEKVSLVKEGDYTLDLFMLPDLEEEADLWTETEEDLLIDVLEEQVGWWKYPLLFLIGLTVGILVYYFLVGAKKKDYVDEKPAEAVTNETVAVETLNENPESTDLDRALEIIRKNDGRIYQTDLRKEMSDLSEAKVSLILTELEHKNLVEKIKKGRGNVVILKR